MIKKSCLVKFSNRSGIGIIVALMIVGLLSAIAASLIVVSLDNIHTVRSFKDSQSGFYAAQSALVLRAREIRNNLTNFNLMPVGESPEEENPCDGSNLGSGSMACVDYPFVGYDTRTYITADENNPRKIIVPLGEEFQGMSALEYRYTTHSVAKNSRTESDVSTFELEFKVRNIPMYQFGVFYGKDLEIASSHDFTITGPVHSSGDIYFNPRSDTLRFDSQVTSSAGMYNGSRFDNVCAAGQIEVKDPLVYQRLGDGVCLARKPFSTADMSPFNKMIISNVEKVYSPSRDIIDLSLAEPYYRMADLKVSLLLDNNNNPDASLVGHSVVVYDNVGDIDQPATVALNACSGSLSSKSFKYSLMINQRENKQMRLLDVDLKAILECLKTTSWLGSGKLLTDDTDGGLIFHFSIQGPEANSFNRYGVRIKNADEIVPTSGGSNIKGLTFITDQALYVQGNFNSTNKIPASLVGDTFNVLSQNFNDSAVVSSRVANSDITINAAITAGTDSAMSIDGASNRIDSGGLTAFARFHENWTDRTFFMAGSITSLGTPKRARGLVYVGMPNYLPPTRSWMYDTSFNNPANLPPATPLISYLKEQLILTHFNRN